MISLSPSTCFRSSVCYQNQKPIDQSRGASEVKVYVKWNDYLASVDKNTTMVKEFLGGGGGGVGGGSKATKYHHHHHFY